jgi:hypothetical protein
MVRRGSPQVLDFRLSVRKYGNRIQIVARICFFFNRKSEVQNSFDHPVGSRQHSRRNPSIFGFWIADPSAKLRACPESVEGTGFSIAVNRLGMKSAHRVVLAFNPKSKI